MPKIIQKTLVMTLVYCVSISFTAHAFTLEELPSSKANQFVELYDFILPTLITATIIKPKMSADTMVETAIKFINFYSTPGLFPRIYGLGTKNYNWRKGTAHMMSSGNLLCSEQSVLAAIILEPYLAPIRYRHVNKHTFHEIRIDGRWVIIDPYTDMRIKNSQGLPASYDDIQIWLHGNKSALRIPEDPLPRTKEYLKLFKLKKGHKHQRSPLPYASYRTGVGISTKLFFEKNTYAGADFDKDKNYAYPLFVRNNINNILMTNKDRVELAKKIQNFFYFKIFEDIKQGKTDANKYDYLFFARGYQLLGRYSDALRIYKNIPKTDRIYFYMAQCYFKQDAKKDFNQLSEQLKNNPFYRYLYYQLNSAFLLDTDNSFFEKFAYKHINYQ